MESYVKIYREYGYLIVDINNDELVMFSNCSKDKEIEDIEVKDNWIIIDGIKPVSKLPRIDDYATDNKGNKIRHILNYDNNLLFLDKYL